MHPMQTKEKIRIDKYLWSIRLFKTRSAASDACDKGKVRMNGDAVKASRNVHVGDTYEVKGDARKWIIRVDALLDHRVQYPEAIKHYTDLTPPEDKDAIPFLAPVFHTGKRQSKIGRPTKKDRRELDDFME